MAEEVGATVVVEPIVLVEQTCVVSGPINLALSTSRVPPRELIMITIVCDFEVALNVAERVFQPAPGVKRETVVASRWSSTSRNRSKIVPDVGL